MCAGDPFHAGDKALTREFPAQRGGLTGMNKSQVRFAELSIRSNQNCNLN